MLSWVKPKKSFKSVALSAVIGTSREKSVRVGVMLKRGSMEGKVGIALGEGKGSIAVGLGTEVLGNCWQDNSKRLSMMPIVTRMIRLRDKVSFTLKMSA